MKKWLYVVGLDAAATKFPHVEDAALIVGGERHLELLKSQNQIRAKTMTWKSPLKDTIGDILAYRGQKVVVLATGDPQNFGIGVTLSQNIDVAEMVIEPARSAFSLAASRLGWALSTSECLSLHGRPLETLIAYLQPRAKLLVLSHDKTTPQQVAALLCEKGFGAASVTILENMGADNERQSHYFAKDLSLAKDFGFAKDLGLAKDFKTNDLADLNTLAIKLPDVDFLPKFAALPDEAFLHDGQLTKEEVRAMTISALNPFPSANLWDVGAGCGSIAIEWMRFHPSMKAVCFERNKARLELIKTNRANLGVPSLKLIAGDAFEQLAAMDDASRPDAIFIGGGITHPNLFDQCLKHLKNNGILVANAVTLQSEQKLFELYNRYGGTLKRFNISKAKPIGKFTGWDNLMPVTQLKISKAKITKDFS